MFFDSKTEHDSVEAAVSTAMDDESADNCAHLEYTVGGEQFTIQFAVHDEPKHNVTGFKEIMDPTELMAKVSLSILDAQSTYGEFVVFQSEAETVDEAMAEIILVRGILGGHKHPDAAKTYQTGMPDWWREGDSTLSNLKRRLFG